MKSVKVFAIAAMLCAALGFMGNISMFRDANAAEPRPVSASETKDWGSLVDAAGASEDVTVGPSVALGDFCVASMSVDIVDLTMTCNITAANVATVRLQNESTATVDLASGTLRVMVFRTQQTGG